MKDKLDDHPFFTRWEDPETGVANYVLTERRAPAQCGLYFQTPSISQDGRWLWFRCYHPPSRYSLAAVVCLDPAAPDLRVFPQAGLTANPLVRPEGDGIYCAVDDSIYILSIDVRQGSLQRNQVAVNVGYERYAHLDTPCSYRSGITSSDR